jgi:hypothetical protein
MRRLLGIPVVVLALLSGCGTQGREGEVRTVADRFVAAVDRRDGPAACGLLTAQARQELVSSQGEPCAKAVVALRVGDPPVDRVQVWVTNGVAVASRGRWLFLDDTGSGWRVSAAGCEPQPGGQPYDCDLRA